MKLDIITTKNAKNGNVQFPISEALRVDLIKRAVETLQANARTPYGADPRAGLKHSTDVSRRRRKFRGSYGKGISRVPRKVLSKKGSRIYWVGAEAPGTVSGRRAHPPKAEKIWTKKLNRKENRKAINSAMTATLDRELVTLRGHKVPETYPFALDADFESITKTKELETALEALGFADELARGRDGAKSLLIVTDSEALALAARNLDGVEVATPNELNAHMLAPGAHPGRATLFTTASIASLAGEPQETKAPAKAAAKKTAKKAEATA